MKTVIDRLGMIRTELEGLITLEEESTRVTEASIIDRKLWLESKRQELIDIDQAIEKLKTV